MKGKSSNLVLMNLECKKKMLLFAENCIKLLVQGKLWLELIQILMKDPYRDRAGGKTWWNADCFNRMHTVSSSCTISFIKAWPWWRALVVWEGPCLGFMQSLWCEYCIYIYCCAERRRLPAQWCTLIKYNAITNKEINISRLIKSEFCCLVQQNLMMN